ncbi:MAG TPA: hypothetical protein VKU41_26965 [Polyangiaceae bacterium]|nr:hypothetical protein [Polyangiaceae bacterium]
MTPFRSRRALSLLSLVVGLLFAACGGRSDDIGTDAAGTGDAPVGPDACNVVSPCPSSAVWDPVRCACEPGDAASSVPDGSDAAHVEGSPADVSSSPEAGPEAAADAPIDAPEMDAPRDAAFDAPVSFDGSPPLEDAPSDGTLTYADSPPPPPYDATFVDSPVVDCFDASLCGPGNTVNASCQCVPCANTCPIGQTPAAGCGSCVACPYACPAGLVDGPGCSCLPPGVDGGPQSDAGDAATVVCSLMGYDACPAGSWCQLGVCPDGKTQYGCFCNADGTTNCQVVCPAPPPCVIPGQGTCPYNASCAFDTCTNDPSATAFVCSCGQNGQAYCSSYPCSGIDGGVIFPFGDSGAPPGTSCLLEGYDTCPVGQFCQLGTCPDGTTPYGCTCNADGTASCQLACPPPPPCTIPGEGTCPYGQSCTFGNCATGVLTCYCQSGGRASCFSSPSCDGGLD